MYVKEAERGQNKAHILENAKPESAEKQTKFTNGSSNEGWEKCLSETLLSLFQVSSSKLVERIVLTRTSSFALTSFTNEH